MNAWPGAHSAAFILGALSSQAVAGTPSVALEECRVLGVDEAVRCGDMLVPEDPRQPHGRKVKLHIVVLPALRPDGVPDLERKWQDVLRTVQAGIPPRLTPGPFAEAIRGQLSSTAGQRRLPLLIDRMSRGDFGPFLALAVPASGALAEGLYLSITCAGDTLSITPAQRDAATKATFLGPWRVDEQTRACRIWNVPEARIPAPVESKVPVLLLQGDRDGVTPLSGAQEVARALPRSRIVTIPYLGHTPEGLSHIECIDEIASAFFDRASAEGISLSCLARMAPPPFATSVEALSR